MSTPTDKTLVSPLAHAFSASSKFIANAPSRHDSICSAIASTPTDKTLMSPLAHAFGASTKFNASATSRHDSICSASVWSLDSTPRSCDMSVVSTCASASFEPIPPAGWRHHPYSYLPTPSTAHAEPIQGAAHQPLQGMCEFIPIPHINVLKRVKPTTDFPVYIGQVKFEATEAHVRWLIRRMTNGSVLPVSVSPAGQGSFVAYVESSEQQKAVRKALHHTVLYDHNGVWHPRTQSERHKVTRYMNDREFRMRGQRLPREMVTAELRAQKPVPAPMPMPMLPHPFLLMTAPVYHA